MSRLLARSQLGASSRLTSKTQPEWPVTLGVCLVALAVRVAVVVAQPVHLVNDSADYERLAVSLAGGHGWGVSHFAPGGGPTALRPPLYPLVLAGLYKITGVHVIAGRLLGSLVGAGAVTLVVLVSRRLWGRRVSVVAGVLAAVLPPMVMASTALMSEALAVPLELAALWLALSARDRLQRRSRVLSISAAGICLGLVVLDRPSLVVLLVPVCLLVVGTQLRRRAGAGDAVSGSRLRAGGSNLVAPALVVLLAFAVTIPWLVRDRVVMHRWVPLTTQGGFVLAGTYNATSAADPRFPAAWRPATFDPADRRLIDDHPHAGEPQTSALLESAALSYVREHPGYVVKVGFENSLRLADLAPSIFTRYSTSQEYGYPMNWGYGEMAGGIFVLALALVGFALPRGRRAVPLGWWSGPVLLWVTTVLLQAVPRFRAVIDPLVVPLAAFAIVSVAEAIWRRLTRSDQELGRVS